jgi:putative phosphoesterase
MDDIIKTTIKKSISIKYRIGVISDTHVPDRVGSLHPDIIPTFEQLKVDHIVHAGDLSSQGVLEPLKKIAPVSFAKGNRDWFLESGHGLVKFIDFDQIKIAISHGHGGFFPYFRDKIPYYLYGYRFERYVKRLKSITEDAHVIIFGHSHQVENQWVNGRLFFNSGSAYDGGNDGSGPTIGLIEICENNLIKGRILPLRKGRWKKGKWQIYETSYNNSDIFANRI